MQEEQRSVKGRGDQLAPGSPKEEQERLTHLRPQIELKRLGGDGSPGEEVSAAEFHTTFGREPPGKLLGDQIGEAPGIGCMTRSGAMSSGLVFHRTDGPDFSALDFAGLSFSEVGGPLHDALQHVLKVFHSKTLPMVKGSILPLPLEGYCGVPPPQQPWLRAILMGLNSLYGVSETCAGAPSDAQKELVVGLVRFLDRMWLWTERIPQDGFSQLFDVKGVDYRGEEIKLARAFNWTCIASALPKEVGTLNLADFCSGGCRYYVESFEEFLLPMDQQVIGRAPRVLVHEDDWLEVCSGLIDSGICGMAPLSSLFHLHGQPLLNGLFAVSKNEFDANGVEQHRLIMNMVPVNRLCRSLRGDVGTLPTIAGFSAFYLEDSEVAVMSSEDIKCFYYLFKIPKDWQRFMGFARPVPHQLVPPHLRHEPCHLVAQVLPMGFINSVGLAQHIHRNVIRWTLDKATPGEGGERELRRDRPAPVHADMFRVYLDNWDQIRKVDKALVSEVEGTPSVEQLALRHQYSELELPRHPRKSVESSCKTEVQGALLDGRSGVAFAKPEKVLKYLGLGWELVKRDRASMRELQVVAGGFVYITMFRRPLLCCLNEIWSHIESLKGYPPVVRVELPVGVRREILRFMALVPLAQMDFRLPMTQQVTASDASSSGGGICCSTGLTPYGLAAEGALVRGELPEPMDVVEVLTIGLFDGIGALRVAADLLHLPVAGHISVECDAYANRVLEAGFPGATFVDRVQDVTAELVQQWACEYSSVGVVLIGAGPPCQDVSKLNVDRKGSQRGRRSSLYKEIPRVKQLVEARFPWAQVHIFVESVASMDKEDRSAMSMDLGLLPQRVDSVGISLARRPRLYWMTWELVSEAGLGLTDFVGTEWERLREVLLTGEIDQKEFLEPGWMVPAGQRLATFTTSRPSNVPGRRPAGLYTCDDATLARWRSDQHRYPPYQYKPEFCVHHGFKECRVASIQEREVILGFPVDYTAQCVVKQYRHTDWASDIRKSLLGNSWSVPVVVCLLKQLFERLGIVRFATIQQLLDRLAPGGGAHLQTVLRRPPLARASPQVYRETTLARRLSGLVSIKGEDLLLQASSEQLMRTQRLRASIPSKLWKWKTVTGWAWQGTPEHINVLEMRAVLTTVKYWIVKRKMSHCKIIHLTDSLVVLHALSRGRSSSRKLRRTIMRISALLLTANLHPVWTYVHTGQNPADRPSRRVLRRKWQKVKSI